MSATTAEEPPEELRDRLLAEIGADPVRSLQPSAAQAGGTVLAAAAAVVIGLGALGIGLALRPPTVSTAEQIFAAPDVRTVSGDIPAAAPRPSCSPVRRTRACW